MRKYCDSRRGQSRYKYLTSHEISCLSHIWTASSEKRLFLQGGADNRVPRHHHKQEKGSSPALMERESEGLIPHKFLQVSPDLQPKEESAESHSSLSQVQLPMLSVQHSQPFQVSNISPKHEIVDKKIIVPLSSIDPWFPCVLSHKCFTAWGFCDCPGKAKVGISHGFLHQVCDLCQRTSCFISQG